MDFRGRGISDILRPPSKQALRPVAPNKRAFSSKVGYPKAMGAAICPIRPKSITKPKVRVILKNRWALFYCDPEIQIRLKKYFRYQPPGFEWTYGYQNGGDGYKNFLLRGRVPSGLFLEQQTAIGKRFDLVVENEIVSPSFVKGTIDIRDYQETGLQAMMSHPTGGLILSATGTGKTRLAAAYFERLVGRGLFIVDELGLLEQTRLAFSQLLAGEIGVVGRGEFHPERITVATIQTLARHQKETEFKKWFASLTAVIIDELHVALNRRNIDIVSKIKPLSVFGLTGTLEMEKLHARIPAVAIAGPPIFKYSAVKGMADGVLSQGLVVHLEGESPRWHPRDSTEDYRVSIVRNWDRNSCIADLVMEGISRGRRPTVMVEAREHLYILEKIFQGKGVRYRALSGKVKAKDRLHAIELLDRGEISLILATRVFGKGIDAESVDLIIDATGLPSGNNAQQRFGRGTRMSEKTRGKTLIHIDISDTNGRFLMNARARKEAFKAAGIPQIVLTWTGAPDILSAAEKKLSIIQQ